jgi:hypothetical protein
MIAPVDIFDLLAALALADLVAALDIDCLRYTADTGRRNCLECLGGSGEFVELAVKLTDIRLSDTAVNNR